MSGDPSNAWTVILSRATDVWHEPYPVGRDVLRVGIRPGTRDHMEALAFYFPVVGRSSAVLRLHWGTTVVDMPIEVGDGPGQESGSAPSGAP